MLTGSRHIPGGMSKADAENQAMRHAHGLAEISSKVLIIDSGKDHVWVDHGAVHLRADRKGIGHDVVYDVRVSLREAVYRSHRCLIYDRGRAHDLRLSEPAPPDR